MQTIEDLYKNYFLEYSSYVIKERAIPYIEDGFKPVQRRIIHTLLECDDGGMHKVAYIVGQAMKYHPHGDSSIYEALVTLQHAGYFIKGGGNFGNIFTGTPAAAARYIECKILPFAKAVLYSPEITKYIPTYDSKHTEPVVFPAKLPTVLLQGTCGIAIGMATKILPCNPLEVINCMKDAIDGKDFVIYPDLPTGGIIDVSEFNDGKGSLSIRSKVDVDYKNRKLIIRELPYGVTTEELIDSINNASKKKKLDVVSITDYTSENVNIEIELSNDCQNIDAELNSLYAHTDTEVSVKDLSPILIKDGHPVEMGITEIIKFHAKYLIDILKAELGVEKGKLRDKLQVRTLERIFIEERIYKRIEELRTEEEIFSSVKDGLLPFKKEFVRDLTDDDVKHLLSLQIRRISLFDIEKNKKDIAEIKAQIKLCDSRLANINDYAKETLDNLAKMLPKDCRRKTEISTFETIKIKDVAKKNRSIKYDKSTGYLGYDIAKGEEQVVVSDLDKIILLYKDGTFQMQNCPAKIFVGKNLLYVFDADRNSLDNIILTIIFREKTSQITLIKRCKINKGFILEKSYSLLPDGSYEVLKISTEKDSLIKMLFTKGKNREQEVYFSDFLVKGASSQGVRLTTRELESMKLIKTEKPKSLVDENPEGSLIE